MTGEQNNTTKYFDWAVGENANDEDFVMIGRHMEETKWQHSEECTCRLRNIAMRDYKESVTTGQTYTQTDRQTPDKVIPMCRYVSQATLKPK